MVIARVSPFAAAILLAATAAAPAGPLYSANLTNAVGVGNSSSPVILTSSQDQSEGRHGEGVAVAGSVLAASVLTSKGVDGFNNGIFTDYSASVTATYDDIFITGPGGAPVPFTLHVPFNAIFTQSYDSLTLPNAGFTDRSGIGQTAELVATLGASSFGQSGEQLALGLDDQNDTANIGIFSRDNNGNQVFSAIQPGASPGPSSSESHGAITILHNFPLDGSGFLYLDRTQTPITAPAGIFGPGAGLHFDDVVRLRGEMILPGIAQVGVPLTLHLAMSIRSIASGGFQLTSSGGIDARHTFGVPQNGALVFDLPDGYTANSESLNIVNNRVPGAAATAVPEPGGLVLLGTALVGLVALRKRFVPAAKDR